MSQKPPAKPDSAPGTWVVSGAPPAPAPRCPRCGREVEGGTARCAACGAPLLLGDESARALDVTLDLDRRGTRREAPAAVAALAPGAGSAPPPLPAAAPASSWSAPSAPPRPPSRITVTPLVARPPPPAAAPAIAAPGAPAEEGWEVLPEAQVDTVEIHVVRPEPWRRAVAWLVDGTPFAAAAVAGVERLLHEAAGSLPGPGTDPAALVDLVARERVIVLSVAAAAGLALAVYLTLAHALAGATLGKRVLGLRVIGPDGRRPTLARSAARTAAGALSAALLGLGFLAALFTRTGRALHDLVARTWVAKAP